MISYSSAPLQVKFENQAYADLIVKRNFGFQLNVPFKMKAVPGLFYEINYGVDSYSFDLQPTGIIRSFFIHYLGASVGYENKWYTKNTKDFLRLGGGVSFLHFRGARSKILVFDINKNISSLSTIGTPFPVVFSPHLKIDYNWQTESLRSFRVGIYAATSFQNILIGDFSINDDLDNFSGSIKKKHEYFGIQLGVNVSQARKQRVKERVNKGLLKDPKPINNTISKFNYAFNMGTGSKIFISNPNTYAAERPEMVNLNLSYGVDMSRSIPILDKYHALLAFSFHTNESKIRAVYKVPSTDELITIDTKLNDIHIISGGLGYNFLKNNKNKQNFFQLATILNLNANLFDSQAQLIQNPIDDSPLWSLTSSNEGRVFFSSKLNFDHYRKIRDNRYLRMGLSLERGRDIMVGQLENGANEISEFYQNNFAIRLHLGILLKSEKLKI